MTNLEALFVAIRARVEATVPESDDRQSLLAHLESLARWDREPGDYPVPGLATFPSTLAIAYAVCHADCGGREFIVDGSTQECQHCGRLLFRTETRDYALIERAT